MTHRLLSIDFQRGRPCKTYTALIEGDPDFNNRVIDLPIGQRPGGNSVLMSAKPDAVKPRHARTDVVITKRCRNYAVAECQLHTGRNHQIRVHLAEIGHPVVADEYYGSHGTIRESPRFRGHAPAVRRHALHAAGLSFQHPVLQTWLEFTSQPPLDFWKLAD